MAALLDDPLLDYELVRKKLNITATVIRALEEQHVLAVESEQVYRNPVHAENIQKKEIIYTQEQKRAIMRFCKDYGNGIRKTYLLHGVTGSGKTEVYMEMIQSVVDKGKQAIVLIPEIALTYQTVMRFYRRFKDRVSVMNSRLSAGERYDQMMRAKAGEVDVMIGPRSALFTPFPNLGLIVIDEEHEPTYKSEQTPRYHARETALRRAQTEGASVVLGSATPSMEAMYRAKNGERPLYAMQASLPLEDFLHIDGLEKDMETSLDVIPEHLDCQIINDRKIGVKAVLGVTATGERQNHTEILSGISGEGIESLQGILRMEQNTAPLKDRFTVKEEITLPSAKPEIADVLWQTIDLIEQDIRAMDGKVMVRGNLRICMLYCDTEGNLGSFCEKIPFSGYLEGEGIEPKTELTGTLQIEDAKLTPTVDEDGEARQLAVDVAVSAALQGRETVEREILQDAYAPTGMVMF